MSVTVYQVAYSTFSFRLKPPFGGGIGTYISSYKSTGTAREFRFYHYYDKVGSDYRQNILRNTADGGSTFTSYSTGLNATLSNYPYAPASWTGGTPVTGVTTVSLYVANITANAYGTVSLAQLVYDYGTAFRTATATPVAGSSFIGWYLTGTETQVTTNDDFTVTDNVITLKRDPVSADIAVEARFTAVYALTTVASGTGNAYIGSSPSTITTANYQAGTSVVIRAVVSSEFHKFSKWTKGGVDVSTDLQLTITTDAADATYTAVFIPIAYALDVTPDNASHGSVAVFLDNAEQGTQTGLTASSGVSYADPVVLPTSVRIVATPVFGYSFTGWYIGASLVSSSATYTFNMPEYDVAIEAEFTVLSQAPLTVTKTKGVSGDDADAKDRGSVSLYHLESVLDTTSAVGTATLVQNIYTSNAYKLVATKADARYQFDGWYQTIEEVETLIVTGGIFVVDGANLYITASTTDAIPVNAQFSETVLCTIQTVASDSTTYVAENPAEDAGCSCSVTSPAPDFEDEWYSDQTITVEAVQASGWELQQWLVKINVGEEDEEVVAQISKGEEGFGQTFTFTLPKDCQVIAKSAYTLPPDQLQVQALHKTGQDVTSGTLEIHPCGDTYVILTNGVRANVDEDSVCEITAIPANGYKFVSWRISAVDGDVVSLVPVYSFISTVNAVFYAEFAATTEEPLVLFEGSSSNRTMKWSSKTYIASIPSCFSSARIYAEAFPIVLSIGSSENPSMPANPLNMVTSIAASQKAFRLPTRRPDKFFMFSVQASATVLDVAIATSMEGIKNG
jgi:hypothetical protein